MRTIRELLMVAVIALAGLSFGAVGGCYVGLLPSMAMELSRMPSGVAELRYAVIGLQVGAALGLIAALVLAVRSSRRVR